MNSITLFLIIKGILALVAAEAAVAGVLTMTRLTLAAVYSWFRSRTSLRYRNNYAVTIKEGIRNGRFVMIRGVLDSSYNLIEAETIHASELDHQLATRHARQ